MNGKPVVGIHAADPRMRALLLEVVEAAGGVQRLVERVNEKPTVDVLVHCVGPRGTYLAEWLTECRRAGWTIPTLLCAADGVTAERVTDEVLNAVLGVRVAVCHGTPDDAAHLTTRVRQLLGSIPAAEVCRHMTQALEPCPPIVAAFVRACLAAAAPDRAIPAPRVIAKRVGRSLRTIERRAAEAGLPMPRELLGLAELLYRARLALTSPPPPIPRIVARRIKPLRDSITASGDSPDPNNTEYARALALFTKRVAACRAELRRARKAG